MPNMMTRLFLSALLAALCAVPAIAMELRIGVSDGDGRALADAVLALYPEDGAVPRPVVLTEPAQIDQIGETFVPFVVAIPVGGAVRFLNSDPVSHQVYSFSGIRRFELQQPPGRVSEPITFDEPGEVAVGCNIHDHMIAFIRVTDAPYFGVTDAEGSLRLDLPEGMYRMTAWHPFQRREADPMTVSVGPVPTAAAMRLDTRPDPRRRHGQHRQQRRY